MFDNLLNLVKGNAAESIINNSAVPNEKPTTQMIIALIYKVF